MNTSITKQIPKTLIIMLSVLLMMSSVSAVAVPGESTGPKESLPYHINQNTNITPSDTLVVSVGTGDKIVGLSSTVSNHLNAPLVTTDHDQLSKYVIETVQQQMKYGELEEVIVVGVSDNTSDISSVIADLGSSVKNKSISVYTLYRENIDKLSRTVTLYGWNNSNGAIVTDLEIHDDVSKSVYMSYNGNLPVISEKLDNDTIINTLEYLNANTVYVTDGVDIDTKDNLSEDYSVDESWQYYELSNDTEYIVANEEPSKNATYIVSRQDDKTSYSNMIQVIGNANVANASIIVTENETVLGTDQEDYLSSEAPEMPIIVGDESVISESLANEISSVAGNQIWRITSDGSDLVKEKTCQVALASNYYTHPIVVYHAFETEQGSYTYSFENIGFSDVVKFEDYSLKVTFDKNSGTFKDSIPSPEKQTNDKVVYHITDPIYPQDSESLTFDVSSGTSFNAVPKLSYRVGMIGGLLKTHQSYFNSVIGFFDDAKDWIKDIFNDIVGFYEETLTAIPWINEVMAGLTMLLVLWTIVGAISYVVKWLTKKKIVGGWIYGPIVGMYKSLKRI